MSQAQYLIIVLGIIIVGVAVAMGMKIFNENRKKANLDALAGETYELAIDAQRWMRKPEFFGGGGDTCAETCDWSDATLPAMGYASNSDGEYVGAHGVMSLEKSDPLVLQVIGTNSEMGNQVIIDVYGTDPFDVTTDLVIDYVDGGFVAGNN